MAAAALAAIAVIGSSIPAMASTSSASTSPPKTSPPRTSPPGTSAAMTSSGAGSLGLGVLEADYRNIPNDQAAGIANAVINLSWGNWEPSAGVFDPIYMQSIRSAIARYTSAGWKVSIDVGLQQAPSWVYQTANSRLVDQNGRSSPTADFEFSNQVRSAATAYIDSVTSSLTGVEAYRIGLSENGEILYPDTSSNQWWAFSPAAQSGGPDLPAGVGADPMPGWIPGTTAWGGATVTGAQVSAWYSWYLGAMVNAHAWEMTTFRNGGFGGQLDLVMPGMGALPQPMNQRLAADLAPGSYDSFDTLNTGAVWWKFLDSLPSLTNTAIDDSSLYDWSGAPRANSCQAGDESVAYTDQRVFFWSDTRWLASLAHRHGMGFMAENPGANTPADLAPMIALARSCGVTELQWAWDYTLQGGHPVSAAQLGAAVGSTQPPAAPASFTTALDVSNSNAHYELDVAGASLVAGAPVIDWWANGNANQSWRFVGLGASTYDVVNVNSGQCLTTDGKLGDGLYQSPCASGPGQSWSTSLTAGSTTPATMENPASGLYIDVAGNSISVGARIHGWTATGNLNQRFSAS